MARADRGRYLMEGPGEAERLEAKTSAEETRRQLSRVGLRKGMRVLDAGCGTGAVARVMAERVGKGGAVVAVDGSTERLAVGRRLAGNRNIQFVAAELTNLPLSTGQFDMVWCRFVFEYLAHPIAVITELVRVLRVGGTLVIGDLDCNGLCHWPLPRKLERTLYRLVGCLKGRFDPFAGRKLFAHFRRLGLESIEVDLLPYHLYAGAAPPDATLNWRRKLDGLAPVGRKLLGREAYRAFRAEFLELLASPDTFSYSTLILIRGKKPRPG